MTPNPVARIIVEQIKSPIGRPAVATRDACRTWFEQDRPAVLA